MVTGAILVVRFALARGIAPPLALVVLQAMVVAIVAALERWMPEHASWNRPRDDVRADVLHALVSGIAVSAAVRVLVFATTPSLGVSIFLDKHGLHVLLVVRSRPRTRSARPMSWSSPQPWTRGGNESRISIRFGRVAIAVHDREARGSKQLEATMNQKNDSALRALAVAVGLFAVGCVATPDDGANGAVSQGNAASQGKYARLKEYLESYPRLDHAANYDKLKALSATDHWMIDKHQAFASEAYYRACHVNPQLLVSVGGTAMTCAALGASLQSSIQLGYDPTDPNRYAEQQRGKLLIMVKCWRGEYDQATCKAYFGALWSMAQGTHDTTQKIIDNFGDNCRVGIDPNCFP
jgi:hypothetical protein